MMRRSVDLPQPEAPIRQTNSPLLTSRSTWRSASTRSAPIWKILLKLLTSRKGLRSAMVLGAPAQDAVVQHQYDAVAEEAGDADHDHAGDDQVGPRERAPVHDHRAEAGGHAGHLADHDEDPGEAVAEAQAVEDRRQRRRQHDLPEHARAVAAEHRRGLEQLAVHRAHAEDRVEQDRVERAEED